jgi:hypothetical protein
MAFCLLGDYTAHQRRNSQAHTARVVLSEDVAEPAVLSLFQLYLLYQLYLATAVALPRQLVSGWHSQRPRPCPQRPRHLPCCCSCRLSRQHRCRHQASA